MRVNCCLKRGKNPVWNGVGASVADVSCQSRPDAGQENWVMFGPDVGFLLVMHFMSKMLIS